MMSVLRPITFAAALAATCAMLTESADAGAFARRTYYIAVYGNGKKARGTTGTKSTPPKSIGHYQVTFPVRVSACAYAATVGSPKPLSKPASTASGAVSQITPVLGNAKSLFVVTSKQGTATNLGFYLIVTC
jgi:hypothetical protein